MAGSKIRMNIVNGITSNYFMFISADSTNKRVILNFKKNTEDEGSFRIDCQPTGIFFQYRNATTWETIYQA